MKHRAFKWTLVWLLVGAMLSAPLGAMQLPASQNTAGAGVLALAEQQIPANNASQSPPDWEGDSASQSSAAHFAEDRVLVKFAVGNQTRARGASAPLPELGIAVSEVRLLNPSKPGFGVLSSNAQNNVYVLTLEEPGANAVEHAVELLNQNPLVEIAEPDYRYELYAAPNDPMYDTQWALDMIQAEQAWSITKGSKSVVVGVIDTGIDGRHPDLVDNLWVNPNPNQNGYTNDVHGYNFTAKQGGMPTDNHGHGTHVAGIIGAKGNNGTGVSGINWDVSLAWLGVQESGGELSVSACIEALNYANNHNIPITNNSYGGYGYSQLFEDAIRNYNGLFVAGAANDSNDNDGEVAAYPASYDLPNIISVAATDENDELSYFSNYGEKMVHIAAPGSNILSTYTPEPYESSSGTSMACPYVAGTAALVLAANPGYSAAQIKSALLGGADSLHQLDGLIENARRLDAYHALVPWPEVQSISVAPSTLTLDIGETGKLTSEALPAGAQAMCRWESSDPETVLALSNGAVAALKPGQATITAYSLSNPTVSASATVTVTNIISDAIMFLDNNFKRGVVNTLRRIDPEAYEGYSVANNLYPADVEKIKILDVNENRMRNLEGLQHFTNLKELYCGGNLLTSLDVSQLSNLVVLWCFDNLLTELDVSHNRSLADLRCSWNPIEYIDLRNCTELEIFFSSGNPLKSLDLSNNKKLDVFGCGGNQLEHLDLSNNPALTYLTCADNPLTSLDVSNNSNLEYVRCEETLLERLDLSNRSSLISLSCGNSKLIDLNVSNCSALEYLYCNTNQLTNLDLENCSQLKYLWCFANPLTALDLRDCVQLRDLWCTNTKLTELDLTGSPWLYSLNCHDNQLSSLDISNCKSLETLWCQGNQLEELDASACTQIEYLQADKNPLKRLYATLEGQPTSVTANGQGSVAMLYNKDMSVLRFTAELNPRFLCWTESGVLTSNGYILELQPGRGYDLTAHYREDYFTVRFDSKGGSQVWTVFTESNPAPALLQAPPPPVRGGYTFGGWYQDEDCTIPWRFESDLVTGDMILYAKWDQVSASVTGVSLDQTAVTMTVGDIVQLREAVLPANASDQSVRWSSSDFSIAPVTDTGLVYAAAEGTATITVTTADGAYTAHCFVAVGPPPALPSSISLSMDEMQLAVGNTAVLEAAVYPEDAIDSTVGWSSEDTFVATVDDNGLVTAIAPGTTTIMAKVKAADGIRTAYCVVSVFQGHSLTVINGSGSGNYIAGSNVSIQADVSDGKIFDYWALSGEGIIDNMYAPETFITTADSPATITAVYYSNISYIPGTRYEVSFWNWIMYIFLFGWIWMRN